MKNEQLMATVIWALALGGTLLLTILLVQEGVELMTQLGEALQRDMQNNLGGMQ